MQLLGQLLIFLKRVHAYNLAFCTNTFDIKRHLFTTNFNQTHSI